jgi:hypothetical protein
LGKGEEIMAEAMLRIGDIVHLKGSSLPARVMAMSRSGETVFVRFNTGEEASYAPDQLERWEEGPGFLPVCVYGDNLTFTWAAEDNDDDPSDEELIEMLDDRAYGFHAGHDFEDEDDDPAAAG